MFNPVLMLYNKQTKIQGISQIQAIHILKFYENKWLNANIMKIEVAIPTGGVARNVIEWLQF